MPESIIVLDGHTLTAHFPGAAVPPGEPSWEDLADLGAVTVHPRTLRPQVVERAAGARLLLTNKSLLLREEIGQLPDLRYIGVLATGTNVVDLEAAAAAGVTVTNVPGYSTESVVQHVFALVLELSIELTAHVAAARPADDAVGASRSGGWPASRDFSFTVAPITELAGRTLGVVGFGAIGRRVGAVGHALGMTVVTVARPSLRDDPPPFPVEALPLDDVFACADVVTLHCPLTDATRGLVNRTRLDAMKPGALLINTARGPLIDEAAVADALRGGRLGGAGLDVLSTEPPAADNPLLTAPRCRVTPHIAWATQAARGRLMSIAVDNVAAFLRGTPQNVVAAPST